jgi:hypothetical protein
MYRSGGVAPQILTLALDGGEFFASRPGRFTQEESSQWTQGFVGLQLVLAILEDKRSALLGTERRSSCP